MKRDRCGVCGGDNASCKTISGFYNTVSYGKNPHIQLTLKVPVKNFQLMMF